VWGATEGGVAATLAMRIAACCLDPHLPVSLQDPGSLGIHLGTFSNPTDPIRHNNGTAGLLANTISTSGEWQSRYSVWKAACHSNRQQAQSQHAHLVAVLKHKAQTLVAVENVIQPSVRAAHEG